MSQGKKNLVFLLIMTLMMTVFTGCSSTKTAREVLSEALLNEEDITTSQFKMTIALNVDGMNSYDPEFALYANMLNNAKLTIEGKTDLNAEETAAELKLDLGGMAFNASMYHYDNKIVLQMPFLAQVLGDASLSQKYILMDLNEFMGEIAPQQELEDFDEEAVMALYRKIVVSTLEALSDGALVDKGDQTVAVGGQDVKAREIEVVIGGEEVINIIKNFFSLLRDGELRDEIFLVASIFDPYLTKEDFHNRVEEALKEMDENEDEIFDEIRSEMDFENFNIQSNVYIDNSSNIVKSITEANISFREEQQSVGAGLKVEAESWDINKPIAIDLPEISAENSIDFYELLLRAMFSSFY